MYTVKLNCSEFTILQVSWENKTVNSTILYHYSQWPNTVLDFKFYEFSNNFLLGLVSNIKETKASK